MTSFSEASPEHADMLERALNEAGLGYWRDPSPDSSLTLGAALSALVALNPEAMMPVEYPDGVETNADKADFHEFQAERLDDEAHRLLDQAAAHRREAHKFRHRANFDAVTFPLVIEEPEHA